MACDRFAEAIRENAHGLPLRTDAAAHLAVCSDCQEALETEKRVLATINTALEELATTGPSPNFVSSVRAHVEHAPRWMPGAWWTPAAVAALALLVLAVVVGRLPRERSGVHEVSASRPIEVPVVAPAEEAAAPSPDTAKPDAKRIARVRRQQVPEPAGLAPRPEVLVPEQQREAFSRLFASLRAGRPEVIAMLMSFDSGEQGIDSRGLVIEPLRIEPVAVSALPSSAFIFDK
jgi:hypothetical protein